MVGRCSGLSRTCHCVGIGTTGGSVVVGLLVCGEFVVVLAMGSVTATGSETVLGDVEQALNATTATRL
jgi:hypothetical protein